MNRKKLLRELDTLFSKYLREKRASDGVCICFTCGKLVPKESATVGHFIKRQFLGTRYNEINCQIQCRRCNWILQGNDYIFAQKLKETYGAEIIEKLIVLSRRKVTNIELFNLFYFLKNIGGNNE